MCCSLWTCSLKQALSLYCSRWRDTSSQRCLYRILIPGVDGRTGGLTSTVNANLLTDFISSLSSSSTQHKLLIQAIPKPSFPDKLISFFQLYKNLSLLSTKIQRLVLHTPSAYGTRHQDGVPLPKQTNLKMHIKFSCCLCCHSKQRRPPVRFLTGPFGH